MVKDIRKSTLQPPPGFLKEILIRLLKNNSYNQTVSLVDLKTISEKELEVKPKKLNLKSKKKSDIITIEKLENLLNNLSSKRSHNYDDWLKFVLF